MPEVISVSYVQCVCIEIRVPDPSLVFHRNKNRIREKKRIYLNENSFKTK